MAKISSVGRISKLFGAEGELVATLYDTFPDEIDIEEPLFIKIDGLAVPLFISRFDRRGKKGAVVGFDDIDNVIRAEELIGLELMMPESEIENSADDNDELLFDDLIGFRATINNTTSGMIVDYIDNPMNPLFTIDIDGCEVLIPATEEMFSAFDFEAGTVGFELPEGLLELYLEQ